MSANPHYDNAHRKSLSPYDIIKILPKLEVNRREKVEDN